MNKENQARRVWIYTRQRESGQELVAQQVRLAREAKHNGYKVVGASMDDHSGWPFQRPGLTVALHSIRRGEVDALLVTRMGMVSHDDRILYYIFKILQNHGAALLTTDYQLGYRLFHTWLEYKIHRRSKRWGLPLPW